MIPLCFSRLNCLSPLHRHQNQEDGQAIGYVGISVPHFLPDILPAVEAGWRFDPVAWGQAYATEGASAA
ncbi:GNAT family N-acetyltransferase [Novosphingobium sp.]|uniref:GNAT family N-acetyltransferase n=1 Tax=Novosphingobium sp. TaxID=1874826 RepID=UPI003C7E088A